MLLAVFTGLSAGWDVGDALKHHHVTKHTHHSKKSTGGMKMKLRGQSTGATLSKPWEVTLYKDGAGCITENLLKTYHHTKADEESDYVDFRPTGAKFIMVTGENANLDLYNFDHAVNDRYMASLVPEDGCLRMFQWPGINQFKFKPLGSFLEEEPTNAVATRVAEAKADPTKAAKFNVIFSAESSNYFGYQVLANYYGFHDKTTQTGGVWTRLISARAKDDLSDRFPTYHGRRHYYAWRYGPLNKADVLQKWFDSDAAPQEEVIVVIDPDNWLTQDLRPIVDKVKPGEAYAEAAFFYGQQSTLKSMWQEFCDKSIPGMCERKLDLVAVPYFVHRDDLRKIAPLWKKYILAIREKVDTESEDPKIKAAAEKFKRRFRGVQIDWCAEMFAYVFAAAEANVRHNTNQKLQVRDVDGPARASAVAPTGTIKMIHMGRAWLPTSWEPGKKWWMRWSSDFRQWSSSRRSQVWCKCNETAGIITPWPLPDDYEKTMDFQSIVTLTYLHNGLEKYGPVPKSLEYRDGPDMSYYRGLL